MQVSKQGQLGLNVSSGFGVNVIFSVLLLYVLHFVVFRIGALLQEWTPHPKLPSPRPARIRQDRTRKKHTVSLWGLVSSYVLVLPVVIL